MSRPFSYGGELVAYAEGHSPLLWVKQGNTVYQITAVADNRVFVCDHWVRLDTLAREYSFVDGSYCGVEET